MNYAQLLFSELRLVPLQLNSNAELEDQLLIKAMTANEEIIALGYTLSPKDIIELARSPELDRFYTAVKSCIGEVKAKPMYPDFPKQVMDMDEAVFRFHRMIHYLSTYGVEEFTGAKVTKGWLPEVKDTEKTDADDTLLSAKVIALIDAKEQYSQPYRKILTKTERMTDKERIIISECIKNLPVEEISAVNVTFKQNLLDVFNGIFTSSDIANEDKLTYMHSICQHTGDVWKCADYALTKARYHFKTSQKHLLVKLLESYPAADLKANLLLSNKKGERTALMLKFVDFNEYSRSPEHRKAVEEFRSGGLRSWASRAKYLAESHDPRALDHYSERPGMMLRALTYLVRKGFEPQDILAKLLPQAPKLKTQTIVSLCSHFARPQSAWEEGRYEETAKLFKTVKQLLCERLGANSTAIKGKRVYINMPEYDLDLSSIRVTDRSSEGGYIRSGLAYKIPEDIDRIRFFVYWNDKERVDIDLHGSAVSVNGEPVFIGWNTNFKSGALVFSGDMTDSDSAEYIDIDLVKGKKYLDTVSTNINLYFGYDTFSEIDECFVGAMAVKKTGEEIKLYDPKNCFFTHYLTGKYQTVNYGYIDVQNRVIVFDGSKTEGYYTTNVRNTYGHYKLLE